MGARPVRALLALLVTVMAVACIPQTKSEHEQATDRLRTARADAAAVRGAREAEAYAFALLRYQQSMKRPPVAPPPGLAPLSALLDECLRLLQTAAGRQLAEAPRLVALRGVLMLQAGQESAGISELNRAMSLRPTLYAGTALIAYYERAGDFARVGHTCARTVRYLDDSERFDFITDCIDRQHTASAEGGLDWADGDVKSWYLGERQRLESLAEERRQRALLEARRREGAVAEQRMCASRCEERYHYHVSGCGGDRFCEDQSYQAYQACFQRCNTEYQATLE